MHTDVEPVYAQEAIPQCVFELTSGKCKQQQQESDVRIHATKIYSLSLSWTVVAPLLAPFPAF